MVDLFSLLIDFGSTGYDDKVRAFSFCEKKSIISRICQFNVFEVWSSLVIDRYGNFHLTDTDTNMLIITYANTDTAKKKMNSPIPIPL